MHFKYSVDFEIWGALKKRNGAVGSICSQFTLSLAPENIRKPYRFLTFSGDRERVHWERMG